MLSLLAQSLPADSSAGNGLSASVREMTSPLIEGNSWDLARVFSGWQEALLNFGIRVLLAVLLFALGSWLIKQLRRLLLSFMLKRQVEGVGSSLIASIVVALLYLGLGVGVISLLGIQSVSFAALLASMGLAVGMALSGQLQNLAGGVIIVLTKPFSIGNYIQAQTVEGTVRSVTLFHTLITTPENKMIYIPNGILSNGVIVNFNAASTRRVEWIVGIDYASDVDEALLILSRLVERDDRVLNEPEYFVGVHALADSSVNLVLRAWVRSEDYAAVLFDMNKAIFDSFNRAGIAFPFPQVTISQRS